MCSSDLNNFPSDADANANASDYDVNKALHGGRSQPSVIRCKSADVSSASSLIRQEIFTNLSSFTREVKGVFEVSLGGGVS